ncbi:MAG: hypothetical protein HGB05_00210 [Chloroflexi bacterium]|nr:hypothetical protein [Chloroflexota bacterium]
MLTQVPIDANLAASLQQVAAESGKPLEVVMNDLVQNYLREQRHTQLLAEMDRFRANHPDLVSKFKGEYIGLHNGEVLDHGVDGGALHKRLRQKYGSLPILIVQVTESPEQEFKVRHPKLEPTE